MFKTWGERSWGWLGQVIRWDKKTAASSFPEVDMRIVEQMRSRAVGGASALELIDFLIAEAQLKKADAFIAILYFWFGFDADVTGLRALTFHRFFAEKGWADEKVESLLGPEVKAWLEKQGR